MPFWKHLFSDLFDPQITLRGEDLRFFVERPSAPSREIERCIKEEPARSTKFFLSGSPGCGKSTELAATGRRLEKDHAVVGVDVYASAANIARVTGSEVLFMMGAAACNVAREHWGVEVSQRARKTLFDAFDGVSEEPGKMDIERLFKGTVSFVSAGLSLAHPMGGLAASGLSAASDLALSVLPRSISLRPFGGLARELREGDPEVYRLAQALGDILDELRRETQRSVVLLVDGLDKVEDPTSIRQLFLQTRLLDLPTCPVVYNGPIALWLDEAFMALVSTARFQCVPLPNISIEEAVPGSALVGPDRVRQGIDTLRAVVAERLKSLPKDPDEVFEPGALDDMLLASGGVFRDLIHLVHRACRFAHRKEPSPDRISRELAARAISALAREVQPGISNQLSIEELRAVESTGRPSGQPRSIQLLLRGAILAYQDGVPYFRVHPFLRPLLGGLP